MAKVTEITVWTRGVVMDKEARDIANAFAQAAKMEGKFIQAFDNYEDLPDRVLVTTRKYVRISEEDIEMKYLYTNNHPDIVVVVEPTIVKGINVLRGFPKGGFSSSTRAVPSITCSNSFPMVMCWAQWPRWTPTSISGLRTVDFSGSEGGVDDWQEWEAESLRRSCGRWPRVTGMVDKDSLAKIVR